MEKELVQLILPEDMLKHFEIVEVGEVVEAPTKRMVIRIELEEKNQIPEGYDSQQYESKGFYPVKIIQDFPLRGKAVYLAIKRRRWRHKTNKSEVISNDYSLIAEGSKLTKELSDFLKDTGRDPGRYH